MNKASFHLKGRKVHAATEYSVLDAAPVILKGRPGKTGMRFELAPIRHYALIVQSLGD